MKKYRLLRDLPGIKAGAIGVNIDDGGTFQFHDKKSPFCGTYSEKAMRMHPDWFEPVEDWCPWNIKTSVAIPSTSLPSGNPVSCQVKFMAENQDQAQAAADFIKSVLTGELWDELDYFLEAFRYPEDSPMISIMDRMREFLPGKESA